MFPGDLFARFDYPTLHRRVRQGRAVTDFVQFGERFGLLPESLIEEIKAHVGKGDLIELSQRFEPGEIVQFSQGPFHGLEALVTRFIAAKDRVEILIEWLGRNLRAEADSADLWNI